MATQTPSWFNDATYLANKLLQLQSSDPSTGWTLAMLNAELAKYNATPYEHFLAQGDKENVSPNAYFNVSEYLKAKANQMNAEKYEGKTDWVESTVLAEMGKYGVSAWDHYLKVGQFEGVNPSNGLDTDAYFTAKMNLLNSSAWDGRTDWTVSEVQQIFKDAGCSPITDPSPNVVVTAVAAGDQVQTSYNPYAPNVPGVTFTLTTGVDTPALTVNNDTIIGVVSALSSAATLNAGDKIDGLAGTDTLKVDLQGNFTGFTADAGFLKNVENVELTNSGTIARSFAAKGVEGVHAYNLTGAINLSDLAATDAAVNLANRASGTTTINYATDVTAGTADALALGLSGVGTAEVKNAAGAVTTAEAAVTVTAAGIEAVNITAAGTNIVALGANDAKALTATGAGSLKLTAIGTAVKTIDAATLTGALDVDLGDAAGVTSVIAGAGNDKVRATVGDLAINAEINGGAGADTLALTGAIGTVQYQMSGVETIELNGVTTTFSATNASGVANLTVKGAANNATFANMGTADLAVSLVGTASGSVASDHAGATALTVSGGVKAAPTVNRVDTSLTNSTNVALTVEQYNTLGDGTNGKISAAKAQAFTANIAGAMDNDISLAAATSAIFTQTNTDATVTVGLDAAKLTDLQVTTAGNFTVDSGNVSAVESLTVSAAKSFTATAINFNGVANVDLSGAGSTAGVTLANLGATTVDYGITVKATGLANGLTIGNIDTAEGQAVNVNVAGALGAVTIKKITVADSAALAHTGSITIDANGTAGAIELGTLTAKDVTVNAAGALATVGKAAPVAILADTATFTGSALSANNVSVTAVKSGTVVGGIEADHLTVVGKSAAGATAAFTLTGGLNADVFDVTAGAGKTTVTITDFLAGSDTITSTAGATVNAVQAAKILLDAFSITAATADITLVNLDFNGDANAADGFVYKGDTYFASASTIADATVAVKLTGVALADNAVIA